MSAGTGRLAVSFGGLQGIAGEVAAAVTKLETRLNQLEQDLNPLKADWTGEASLAYQQAKTKWEQSITDLKMTLQATGTAVNDSHDDYKATETKNTAAFGG